MTHPGTKGKQPSPPKVTKKANSKAKKPPPPPVQDDDLYESGDICTPEPERDDEQLM